MSETATPPALDPGAEEDIGVADEPQGSRVGLVLAGLIAIAASGALAWWFAAPDRAADVSAPAPVAASPPPPKAEAPTPLRFAAADPDAGEVLRAWNDVRQAYAEGGEPALVLASQACAKSVPAEPQRLDYCLAYDLYASAVAPPASSSGQGDWFAAAGERGLALARTALPDGVNPGNRLTQVAALSKAVMPKPVKRKPQGARPVRRLHKPVAVRPKRPKPARPAAPHRSATTRRNTGGSLDDFLNSPPPQDPLEPPH